MTRPVVLDRSGLDGLVKELIVRDLTVVGPTVRDGATVLSEQGSADELPWDWDDRGPGSERGAGLLAAVLHQPADAVPVRLRALHCQGPRSASTSPRKWRRCGAQASASSERTAPAAHGGPS